MDGSVGRCLAVRIVRQRLLDVGLAEIDADLPQVLPPFALLSELRDAANEHGYRIGPEEAAGWLFFRSASAPAEIGLAAADNLIGDAHLAIPGVMGFDKRQLMHSGRLGASLRAASASRYRFRGAASAEADSPVCFARGRKDGRCQSSIIS